MYIRKIAKHLPHYLSLVGILAAATIAFIIFKNDRLFLIGIVVATSAAYLSWGLIHHLLHKDLYLSVFIEYLAVSILGAILVLALLFRS